jgi:hypothetical protein
MAQNKGTIGGNKKKKLIRNGGRGGEETLDVGEDEDEGARMREERARWKESKLTKARQEVVLLEPGTKSWEDFQHNTLVH